MLDNENGNNRLSNRVCMNYLAEKHHLVLTMDISNGEYKFEQSIEAAIAAADYELFQLEETIQTVETLKPDCDKLDYALAASAGALCGLMDIFLVGKPGESVLGDMTDRWFEDRVQDFAKLCGWNGEGKDSAPRHSRASTEKISQLNIKADSLYQKWFIDSLFFELPLTKPPPKPEATCGYSVGSMQNQDLTISDTPSYELSGPA